MPTTLPAPNIRAVTIPDIQGTGTVSPMEGRTVTTTGIVTGIVGSRTTDSFDAGVMEPIAPPREGIFVQDAAGDGNDATSDGMFIAVGGAARFHVGQQVKATGQVLEVHDLTTLDAAGGSVVAGGDAALPGSQIANPPADADQSAAYWEQREGMLVAMNDPVVATPTQGYGSFTVVDGRSHGSRRDFDNANEGQHVQVGPGLGESTTVRTGDVLDRVEGIVDYTYGAYQVQQTRPATVTIPGGDAPAAYGDVDADGSVTAADAAAIASQAGRASTGMMDAADLDADGKITADDARIAGARAARVTGAPTFSVAQMNAENFFDAIDDPHKSDTVLTPAQYRDKLAAVSSAIATTLNAPDLLGMQEVENESVLKDLVASPALKSFGYQYAILPGGDPRGINNAILYRGSVATVTNVHQEQGQTTIGSKGVSDPGTMRDLFARPPLIADVTVKGPAGATADFTFMVNHLKSKFSPGGAPTEPLRIAEATFLRDLASKWVASAPTRQVIAVGDLNDGDASKAIGLLVDPAKSPLRDVGQSLIPKAERFSYNYLGSVEALDHIMVTDGLLGSVEQAGVRHVNADRPALAPGSPDVAKRATDHDLQYTTFRFPTGK